MNWLAHIYLSDNNAENLLGNFLGDFLVNVKWRIIYNPAIQKGIEMHFAIDKFATLHPVFNQSCRRISKRFTSYAAILIDIFYDHFLAKYWNEYSQHNLDNYVSAFYTILLNHKKILPTKLLNILPALIEENWLVSYKDIPGVEQALTRLSQRIVENGANTIKDNIMELEKNYVCLEKDFRIFMIEMNKFIIIYKLNDR